MNELRTNNGELYAVKADGPDETDLIARGLQEGVLSLSRVFRETPDAGDLALVPAAFSLVCKVCDRDCDQGNRESAERAGWRDIAFTPECADRNYIGVCPECAISSHENWTVPGGV